MSAADATASGQPFAADLAFAGRRARLPDWLLTSVTGLIWLILAGVAVIMGFYPFFAFNLAGAAIVYLDHRRGDALTWPWTLATVVLGPVGFLPYTYWRRRGLPGLDVLQEKWIDGEVAVPATGR